MRIILWIVRILVGGLFIFSGLIKANDPLGFGYKLEEYFEVFAADTHNIPLLPHFFEALKPLSVYLAMVICVIEIVLGVMVLFGIRMQLASWLLLIMIIFFTWLTGYSAIENKVTDCGCFGDFIKLTPWESFTKDIILLILIVILFAFRNKVKPVFRNFAGSVVLVLTIVLAGYFTIHCYNHLPVFDFRAYKPGNDIRKEMTLPEGKSPDQYVTILTYKEKQTGKTADYIMVAGNETQSEWFREKNLKALPWEDSVWMNSNEFVKSNSVIVVKGDKPAITDFHVWDNENQDATAQVLDDPNYHFWMIAYDMPHADKKSFGEINKLAEVAEKNKVGFVGLTATPYELLDPIRHEVNAAFPFYYADGTVLKTIVRSNPGIVLLKGSTVLKHWHHNDVPTFDEVREKYFR